jgi:hypothetical protein
MVHDALDRASRNRRSSVVIPSLPTSHLPSQASPTTPTLHPIIPPKHLRPRAPTSPTPQTSIPFITMSHIPHLQPPTRCTRHQHTSKIFISLKHLTLLQKEAASIYACCKVALVCRMRDLHHDLPICGAEVISLRDVIPDGCTPLRYI